MTIGFRVTNKNASFVLGKLSGFNVWSYALSAEAILRMAHGCGDEAGDVKAWETVRKSLQKEVAMKWFRTCNDRKGKSSQKRNCQGSVKLILRRVLLLCVREIVINLLDRQGK